MIQRLSHVTIWVLNQNDAYDFYVNKRGFKVHTDAKNG
jgi:catechol 2,3-dioxygenase-like lactoylglutathione lyase family enzyme